MAGLSQKNVYVKVKATLQRLDDPNAQPIVFISTYQTDKPTEYPIFDVGYYQQNPLPTIPPQNLLCSFLPSGGVKIQWDKNYEKNIKYYSIERSINGGNYVHLGTTSEAEYVDTEIQKAVKPYKAYTINVSVRYRVRALSEWRDENNILKTQFSSYSDIASVNGSMQIGPLDKKQSTTIVPETMSLSQNFPNPFNPTTTIYYGVKDAGIVTIRVFNSLGQEIETLVDEVKNAGYHYVDWDASHYPSGVYFYRIASGNYIETKRMILTK